jgi:DNA-binding transcriptional LysR family regulator
MGRIEDIAAFVAVAEQESFTAAARRLNRSPTAVTRAVADLEARLGVRLLNRTTRAVSLTDAGARFLGGARRVLADLMEIEQAAAGQGSAPRGELAITAPILFGRLHVLPIVNDYLKTFPDVTARLSLLDRSVDLVEERLDVAIRIGPLPDSSAIATRLGSLRRVVVAAPAYLARRGVPERPQDIGQHDVILFDGLGRFDFAHVPEKWAAVRKGHAPMQEARAVRVAPRLTVTTAEAAIDAAAAGLGLARVLSYQAVDALTKGSLVQVLETHGRDEIPVHLLYPGGGHPPPKLRAFIDLAVPKLRRRLDEIEQALR